MPRDRQHPRRLGRRQPSVVNHAEPVVSEPSLSVSRETSTEDLRPLTKDRVAALEAATAIWVREVRLGGPGPDDTLLYAAPKPPPPQRYAPGIPSTDGAGSAGDRDRWDANPEPGSASSPAGPPAVVRDWSSRHDERSKAFDVSDALEGRVPVTDKLWPIGPVFDQGTTPPLSLHDASGCVGMGVAAAANSLEMAASATDASLRGMLQKEDALALYERAQQLDQVSGEAYAGTSVLAGMKAGQEAGLWTDYLWAFGTRPLAQALMRVGPAVIGIPWFTGMEEPGAGAVIRPSGSPAGGHCMALVGIIASKPGGPWFVAQQSRGPNVGDGGRVLIHHKDLAQLLAGVGEAAIPVPPGGVR